MSHAYLKHRTILYHPTLAPGGQLFDGSESRPAVHPGAGWVESPADFPDAPEPVVTGEAITAAQAEAHLAAKEAAKLREELATALDRAESAERENVGLKETLEKEKGAHAETHERLTQAAEDIRALDAKVKELVPEAAKVENLLAQLNAANQTIANQGDEIAILKGQIQPLDGDGDGKPGGSKPRKGAQGAGDGEQGA